MIDIEAVRSDPDTVAKNLARRGVDTKLVDELVSLDTAWRELTDEVDALRAEQNKANDTIAQAKGDEREKAIEAMRVVATKLKEREEKLKEVTGAREQAWRKLPNLLSADVPDGGEEDGKIVRSVPEEVAPKSFEQKSYLDLLSEQIDLERAAKVSGSRFVYLKGSLSELQLALVRFAFDTVREDGFIPVIPPVLISEQAMGGMGYLDAHADEVYKTQDDLYLTGTSEQSIGAMHMDEVLEADQLPLRYVGYSPCFRREAGSHGKDVRGILRMHQFDKVELFSITTPEQSADEHELLLTQQEKLMQALTLPYRVVALAGRDLGAASAKTYDIETWIPSEQRYRETHSTSNTTDYQSRRLNIRTRTEAGTQRVHMLNGTAFAIGRMLIALAENHQQEDGSIAIPEALHPYLSFETIPAD